ncbi:ribosome biogenesis GTPase Der [Roseibacillus ishigakijimensis]|uniref:GTPase Der n=1 Tax=Roseibacillus ishigakijimensis TaxID=454146 RepID=A0A934RTF4_9BACT|nr:ribosome biogenesis GTPase Der [Roseibacillus ishigakijimensis]MBK1834186.1 ribosome biogenesis GTPase Der [Roseibacillus ishigakijimensis]
MLTVAIVGRPNVGKSALFNRLAGRRIAIVHDQPGVTRDRIAAPASLPQTPCELVDTGGIGEGVDESFSDAVTTEAELAMASADLILFVVDARAGLTPIDEAIARTLRKAERPIELVINKADHSEQEEAASEFARLGFGNGLPTSAEHGRNIEALAELVDHHLAPLQEKITEAVETVEREGLKIAVVGRPNAGKSSLINAILKDERTIVSDIAGTTRDAVDIPYSRDGERHTLIDTAGLRQRSKMDTSVEVFSAMRSERSIRRADLCLLVVDLAAGVTAMDRKIASLIQKENKPCLIVANKWDLFHPNMPKHERLELADKHLRTELFFLHYAPFTCVSAKKNQSLGLVFKMINEIRKSAQTPLTTGQLNRLLGDAMLKNAPPQNKALKKRLKILYGTPAVNDRYRAIPVPEIILFVNDKRLLSDNYAQYLENQIRERYPHPGVPLNLTARSRRRSDR